MQVRAVEGLRAMILAAEGKVFVAGANIKELAELDAAGATAFSRRGNAVFQSIAGLPCVTLARLHGAALGGGLELALACDFRIAIAGVKLGLPETSLGLIPGWHGIQRTAALAGQAAAKRLVFSAAPIAAEEGLRLGLVDAVTGDAREMDTTIASWIEAFRRGGPAAIAAAKRCMVTGDEVAPFAACFAGTEAREGMRAFLEKRPASWMKG
jgi:enoyl-CoA hydratase